MLMTPYIGCVQIWTNYINRPLPKGGNGLGAVPAGSQATQGALGLGEQIAVSAMALSTFLSCFQGYFSLQAEAYEISHESSNN